MSTIFVVLLTAMSQIPAVEPAADIKAHIEARYTATPPVIDGELTDEAWQEAESASRFRNREGRLINVRTIVKFLCDDENLYIGALLVDPEPEFIRTTATQENLEGIRHDDRLDFTFDLLNYPSPQATYFSLLMNATGAILIEPHRVPNPESLCETAVISERTTLSAELSIPLRVFGLDILQAKNLWGVNIHRARGCRRPGGGDDLYWHNPEQPFDDPANFARMVLGPTSEILVSQVRPACEGVGQGNPVTVCVRNLSRTESVVGLSAFVDESAAPSPVVRQVAQMRSTFLRGSYEITRHDPKQTVTLNVTDEESGKNLYRLSMPVDVPPPLQIGFRVPRYDHLLVPPVYALRAAVYLNAPEGDPRTFRLDSDLISAATSNPIGAISREVEPGVSGVVVRARGIPEGPAEFRVRVTADNEPYARDSIPVVRLSQDEVTALPVYIEDGTQLLVDQAPYFPLGWCASADPKILESLSGGPFNCIVSRTMGQKTDTEIKTYLDTANSKDLKIIYSLGSRADESSTGKTGDSRQLDPDILREHVTTWKSHPAILAWNVAEEPQPAERGDVLSNYRMLRQLDMGHPSLLIQTGTDRIPYFFDCTDVFGIRPLLSPEDPQEAGRSIRRTIASARRHKQSWAVVPVSAFSTNRPTGTTSSGDFARSQAPTRREIRYMTYHTVIQGAKGILYDNYDDLTRMVDFEERWEWITEVARQLEEIRPFMLYGERTRIGIQQGGTDVEALAYVQGNRGLILTVNLTDEPREVSIRIPGTWATVDTLFETQKTAEFVSGYIKDTIHPLWARVYQLTGSTAESSDSQAGASE